MNFIKQFFNYLLEWAEEVNEYRRKNNIHQMY